MGQRKMNRLNETNSRKFQSLQTKSDIVAHIASERQRTLRIMMKNNTHRHRDAQLQFIEWVMTSRQAWKAF